MMIKKYPMSDDELDSYREDTVSDSTLQAQQDSMYKGKAGPQKRKYLQTFNPLAPLGTNWQSSKNSS